MIHAIVRARPLPESGRWARRLGQVLAVAAALGVASAAWPAPRAGASGKGAPTAIRTFTFTLPPFCAGPLQVQGAEAIVCEFPVNWVFDEASLSQFATSDFGVTIQAVGGNGGDGGSSLGGTVGAGSGGPPGLAQTTIRGDALSGESLYIYVGNNGNFGASGKGGSGGAATVVATQSLSPKPSGLDGILAAAGGGGGGQGFTGATPPCVLVNPANADFDPNENVPCSGGGGGVAIAIDGQDRIGMARPGYLPVLGYSFNLGNGQPAFFDAGAWVGGAGSSGGTDGSGAFSFAGAPGAGSPASGTWVRESAALTLGSATVLGGNGLNTGGGGGGGVAGGGGAGDAGGAGGTSFAVGSDYGLPAGDAFAVPACDPNNPEAFCAQNWLSPAGTDQPTVVITFWENTGANPLVPADGETIDTDQPSLLFGGTDASAGIHYVLQNAAGQVVNESALINGSATGNFLWTVPAGLLDAGQTYNWYVTDQAGTQLQPSQSFTLAAGTVSSGFTQGWTLYVRSMDTLDTDLPPSLQPFPDNQQPVPTVSTSCSCTCTQGLSPPSSTGQSPLPGDSEYPSCSGFTSNNDGCSCTWTANGEKPTDSTYWDWTPASGTGCTAGSGSCYANAQVNLGAIDIDWSSPANPLGLLVPARLINLTSEPPSPTDGSSVPSLAVPAIAGLSGSCADSTQVQVTFTTQTNGGVRFYIWADPSSGAQVSSPATAIDYWDIPSCSWSKFRNIGGSSSDYYSIAYMDAQVYESCQSPLKEQTGSQSFCLTPGQPYRVRFDAVVPYLPGPMQLGFKLAGMDSGAPIPANWVSTCALDAGTGSCSETSLSAIGSLLAGFNARRTTPKAVHDALKSVKNALNSLREQVSGSLARGGTYPRDGQGNGSPPLLSGEDGTAGAASCTGAGSTVSCTWTANGTWQLPALYTQSGGWITVQALGGAGGAGYPPAINLGGAGGRAQAVLPAEALAGKTLYVYVGESGADEENYNCGGDTDGCFHSAAGGAASLVTTTAVPASFVSGGCGGTAEGVDALVIAGGGGGGGINGKVSIVPSLGGDGGIAIGGSGDQNVIGTGTAGTADPSSYAGQPPAYGSNPYNGTQTVTGGAAALWWPGNPFPSYGGGPIAPGGAAEGYLDETTYAQTWVSNTSVLTLQSSDKQGCSGGVSLDGGGGGGGHAGGGGGTSQVDEGAYTTGWENVYGAGGGGGSSWAAGTGSGVTLPAALTGWRTLPKNDPSQVVISVQCPNCAFVTDCTMQSTPQRPVMRCTLSQSTLPLELDILAQAVAAEIGQDVGDQVPVYLEAWGGTGGSGGTASTDCGTEGAFANGGAGGQPGYARSSHTFGSLTALTSELWLYVGAQGSTGGNGSTGYGDCRETYGGPGAGGAATLVLSDELTTSTGLDNVLLIAAGGGGGGQGRAHDEGYDGKPGDAGGSAIATAAGAASAGGQGAASAKGDGKGVCNDLKPLDRKGCGKDGIGGRGGVVGGGSAGWVSTSKNWTQGQGGQSNGGPGNGGAGGGGYGGGRVGDGGAYTLRGAAGGGAGGSYAAQATLDDSGAPVVGPDGSPSSTNGVVVISFDVCSTYPSLSVCQP